MRNLPEVPKKTKISVVTVPISSMTGQLLHLEPLPASNAGVPLLPLESGMPSEQFRNPGGDYMMRFIGRIQIAAACLVLGFLAVHGRAADSNTSAASSVEVAPSVDNTPPADGAAPADTAPPIEAEAIPASGAAEPVNPPQPSVAPSAAAEPSVGDQPGLDGGLWFHPFAPLRQAFAAHNSAPLFFPGYDGEPSTRHLIVPGSRLVAAFSAPSREYVAPSEPQAAPMAGPQGFEPAAQAVGPEVVDTAQPADGSGACSMGGGCGVGRPIAWFGGADYLLIRPHQTYDSAYEISPNGATGPAVQNVNFNPSFGNAVRVFAGFDTACDESLRFSYTYMFNDTVRSAAVPTGASVLSPLGATLFPGDSIVATEHLLVNLWDIEDVRKLNFAWCNCKNCPCWDVSWSWGVRMAQIEEPILNSASGPDAGEFDQKSTFVGAGPRLGIDVRRQLGQTSLSAYVAGDAALLIGEQRTTGTSTPSGSGGVQAVPNFDVQLGLSWQPTCHINVTSGYLFELFGDATQLSEASGLALLAPPQASSLSYDGFFFRGQFSY
jgi:hypothetical protein